jgi:hypothetical protein
VWLCQFFCFGGKANLVRIFLLNPNFLLVHRNKYLEGMNDGQKTPRGHPDFHSYMKLNVFHIPDIFLVNTLLLYSLSPYSQTERQTESHTRFAWAGGTFFPVVLLCHVSFWFWWEIGFGLHTHVLRVQYSCGVVLVFWLRWEIVFGVMYILSVRYSSVVSKYKHHTSHFNLRKFLLGYFILQNQ